MYIGIAGNLAEDGSYYEIGLSIHDSIYSTDFAVRRVHFANNQVNAKEITDFIIQQIVSYSTGQFTLFA